MPVASSELELEVAHTADLDPTALAEGRALLDAVFGAEMTDQDWEHALGGMHALAWEAGGLIGHASVIQRRLLHGGRALRAGYVEGVAVRADRRRCGVATTMMRALERIVRGAYELGALGASEDGAALYEALGWRRWQGTTWALTPEGRVRTEAEDDGIFVLPVSAPLDLAGELTCDWREGDVW